MGIETRLRNTGKVGGGFELPGSPDSGQVLIGKSDGTLVLTNIIAGANMIVTNGEGTISLESTAGGAASGANSDITSLNALSGKIKAPTQIEDSSNNEILVFGNVASAVNEVKITNAATGSSPVVEVTGGDESISLIIRAKSAGTVQIGGASSRIVSANSNASLEIGGNGTSGVSFLTSFSKKVSTLTDTSGTNIYIDASLANMYRLVAQGNRTVGIPSNLTAGFQMILYHYASGAARTLTLTTTGSGSFRYGSDVTTIVATSSNKTDIFGFSYDEVDQRLNVVSVARGF